MQDLDTHNTKIIAQVVLNVSYRQSNSNMLKRKMIVILRLYIYFTYTYDHTLAHMKSLDIYNKNNLGDLRSSLFKTRVAAIKIVPTETDLKTVNLSYSYQWV